MKKLLTKIVLALVATFGYAQTQHTIQTRDYNDAHYAFKDGTWHTKSAATSCTVNSVAYTTAGDCAFYSALDAARTTGINQALIVDPGETDTCAGWDHPVLSNNATVSIVGVSDYAGAWAIGTSTGTPTARLKQTCNIGTKAVVTYESGVGLANSNGPSATIKGVYIDANSNAGACGDFLRLAGSSIGDLTCIGVAGTNRHGFQFGDGTHAFSTGWLFETDVKNLRVYTNTQIPLTGGSGTVTISGGAATGYAITAAGGVGSFTHPIADYRVIFTGWGVGVSQPNGPAPCAVVPTAHVSTITAGQLAGITFDTNGSGCDPANTYFAVIPKPVMDEAFLFSNFTDGSVANLIAVGSVNVADVEVDSNSAGFSLRNVHGYGGDPFMIRLDGGGVDVDAPNCDTPLLACVADFSGGNYVHGGVRTHASYITGSGDFWTAQNSLSKYGPIGGCSAGAAGYNLIGSTNGPINLRTGISNATNISLTDVDDCDPSGTSFTVTYLPQKSSTSVVAVGGTLHFSTSTTGIGRATCSATSGSGDLGGVPGYDEGTNLVSFPPTASGNAGFISCVLAGGSTVSRMIPSISTSTQTFDIRTMLSAGATGTWAIESEIDPASIVTASVKIASGVAMTANHGTGTSIQHSDGTGATGHIATYAADGSLTDGGAPASAFDPTTASTYFNDFYDDRETYAAALGSPSGNGCYVLWSVPGTTNAPGILQIVSGTVSGSGQYCAEGDNSYPLGPPNDAANPWSWKEVVKVPVLPGTSSATYSFGFSTGTLSVPSTGFLLDPSKGSPTHWYCVYDNPANATVYTDSGVVATTNWAAFSMAQNGTNISWAINGTPVCTSQLLANVYANPRQISLGAVQTNTTTSVSLLVDYLQISTTLTRP